ncbi:hypothetical protein V6M85_06090 [Sulfolobus tengchongensis]|uniref:Uncharacterized protein n=1 Tax=Sulfolobus tengchongensis TaxID=207809 RepID=A0AAX4L3X2_9CREN
MTKETNFERNSNKMDNMTVIKAVRIPKGVVDKLDEILYKKNKRFNQVINEFLENYINYLSKIEDISRDRPIIISSRFFGLLVESLGQDIEKIKERAYSLGKEWGKEYLFTWNESKTIERASISIFINFLRTISKYSGLYKLDIIKKEKEYICIFDHNYSVTYSIILGYYYKGIFESFYDKLDNLADKYEITDIIANNNSLIIKLAKK